MTCGYALTFTKTADRSFSEDRRQMAEWEKGKRSLWSGRYCPRLKEKVWENRRLSSLELKHPFSIPRF
jgi:hypothetical protein